MFLLDTNTCIHFMKNRYPTLTDKLLQCDPNNLFVSSITVYELEYGAAKSSRGESTRQKLALFLAPFTFLSFDAGDAVTAGMIRSFLEKQGTVIGPYDIQIAAQGLARGLTVVTHNVSEFSRVPNLNVEDWV